MKPIITKQGTPITYTITMSEYDFYALLSTLDCANESAVARELYAELHAAKREADGE